MIEEAFQDVALERKRMIHTTNGLAMLTGALCSIIETSGEIDVDLANRNKSALAIMGNVMNDKYNGMKSMLENHGKLIVSSYGTYTTLRDGMQIVDVKCSEEFVFPLITYTNKDIRVKTNDDDKFFAFVGNQQVEIEGVKTWDYHQRAREAGCKFILKINEVKK